MVPRHWDASQKLFLQKKIVWQGDPERILSIIIILEVLDVSVDSRLADSNGLIVEVQDVLLDLRLTDSN